MKLTEQSIPQLVKNIAIPSSVGMFFQTMYNLTDTYYAGTLSDNALSALSLSFAPFLFLMAFGIGMGQGTNALISHAIGSDQEKKAALYQLQSITLSVFVSLMIMLLGFFFVDEILSMMGGQGEVLSLSLDYIYVILMAAPLIVLVNTFNAGLLAIGDSKKYRNALTVGFFLNLLLDPLLCYGWGPLPAFGVQGIAWATFLIQFLVVLYLGIQLFRTEIIQVCSARQFIPRWQPMKEIIEQGFPAALNMMLVSVGIFIITTFVGKFGSRAIAAHGVGMRIEQVVLLPAIGLNSATLSIVGQNFGAKKYDRVLETYFYCLKAGCLMMVFGGILVYGLAPYVMAFFAQQPETIRYGVDYLRIDAFVLPAYTLVFLSVAVLQGLKKPHYGFFLNVLRQVGLPYVLFPLFVTTAGLELMGVWWGIFAVNWSVALLTFVLVMGLIRHLKSSQAE